MSIQVKHFKKNATKAIKNPQIQTNLKRLYSHFHLAREDAVKATHNWEDLRNQAREIKEHVINHLDYYLEVLEENVKRHGGKVYFAKDANAANEYILNIARENDVKLVTKSKSMVSEEMNLNHVFA